MVGIMYELHVLTGPDGAGRNTGDLEAEEPHYVILQGLLEPSTSRLSFKILRWTPMKLQML